MRSSLSFGGDLYCEKAPLVLFVLLTPALILSGIDMENEPDHMGHFNFVLTKCYGHYNNEMKQRAVDLLGSEWGAFPKMGKI